MASPTWWTWVWVNSGSWWWTGRPGVLWVMGSQKVGHDWATELNWIALQHCDGFCHLSTWISHRYIYIPPSWTSLPPSRLSQSTTFELPVLYSKFTLAILYMLMYVFPRYSLNSSHPLRPLLCPQVCSLCLRLHCCLQMGSLVQSF